METIGIEIDAQLANEYFRKYRRIFRSKRTARMKYQEFLRAFVEDRLREEIKFLEQELAATPD